VDSDSPEENVPIPSSAVMAELLLISEYFYLIFLLVTIASEILNPRIVLSLAGG
jgi:hypothetical protein